MFRKFFAIGLVCILSLSMMTLTANALSPVNGPYLWMIAPCAVNQGGQNSTNIDSLDVASDGDVTEEDVAKKGAREGDAVGDYEWTTATLPADGNINAMLVNAGMVFNGDLNDITSYALVVLKTSRAQQNVAMGVSSDDSVKVWVNGDNVHTNAVNRGRGGAGAYQDNFKIDLKKGNNLLMIKVSERGGGWGMYVGVGGDYETINIDAILPVEPANKFATQWATIKKSY